MLQRTSTLVQEDPEEKSCFLANGCKSFLSLAREYLDKDKEELKKVTVTLHDLIGKIDGVKPSFIGGPDLYVGIHRNGTNLSNPDSEIEGCLAIATVRMQADGRFQASSLRIVADQPEAASLQNVAEALGLGVERTSKKDRKLLGELM